MTSNGVNILQGLGVGFVVVVAIAVILAAFLSVRERKAGRQLCSWCPVIRYSKTRFAVDIKSKLTLIITRFRTLIPD